MCESVSHCPREDFWIETMSGVNTRGSGLHGSAFSYQEGALDESLKTQKKLVKKHGWGHMVGLEQHQPTFFFELSCLKLVGKEQA